MVQLLPYVRVYLTAAKVNMYNVYRVDSLTDVTAL